LGPENALCVKDLKSIGDEQYDTIYRRILTNIRQIYADKDFSVEEDFPYLVDFEYHVPNTLEKLSIPKLDQAYVDRMVNYDINYATSLGEKYRYPIQEFPSLTHNVTYDDDTSSGQLIIPELPLQVQGLANPEIKTWNYPSVYLSFNSSTLELPDLRITNSTLREQTTEYYNIPPSEITNLERLYQVRLLDNTTQIAETYFVNNTLRWSKVFLLPRCFKK